MHWQLRSHRRSADAIRVLFQPEPAASEIESDSDETESDAAASDEESNDDAANKHENDDPRLLWHSRRPKLKQSLPRSELVRIVIEHSDLCDCLGAFSYLSHLLLQPLYKEAQEYEVTDLLEGCAFFSFSLNVCHFHYRILDRCS